MQNKLGTDVQYIETNFILVGMISLVSWIKVIYFQRSDYVSK